MNSAGIKQAGSIVVETNLSARAFADFSRFNAFRIGGRGLALALFPLVMMGMGVVHQVTGNGTLFVVFSVIGVVLPLGYLAFFTVATRKQIAVHRLGESRLVYSVRLDEKGITIWNDREHIDYGWEQVYRVYLVKGYAYLYLTKVKAFILPYEYVVEGTPDELVEVLKRGSGTARVKDLRK